MGSIYRNAALTIAISDSKRVRDGFFKSQFQYRTCKFHLSCRRQDGKHRSFSLQARCRSREMAFEHSWLDFVRGTSLATLIVLREREIRWQCQSLYKERIPGPGSINFLEAHGIQRLPPEIFANPGHVGLAREEPLESDELATDERRGKKPGQQNIWERIIANYSRRSITVSSDRLPALAGIIVELEKYWSDKCVAGVWMNYFHELLFWRASGGSRRSCTASNNTTCECNSVQRLRHEALAATWSWLSCEGPIDFLNHMDEIWIPKCEIVSCSVEALDQNGPLGLIRGGRLVLRASVIKGPIFRVQDVDSIKLVSMDDCNFNCHEIYEHAVYTQIQ